MNRVKYKLILTQVKKYLGGPNSNVLINFLAIFTLCFGYYFYRNYFNHINDLTMTTRKVLLLWLAQILILLWAFSLLVFKKMILRFRLQILLLCLGIVSALVFLELWLRIFDKRMPKFTAHHYLSYVLTPNYKSADGNDSYNSRGFRGPEIKIPKPSEMYRIVILGGSSAFDSSVKDWKNDSARVLEGELRKLYNTDNIEVINGATPGWNSWEDLINFEFRVLDLEPDLILIYEGVNDVHARLVTPSSYRGDNSGRRMVWDKKPCNLLCLKIVQRLAGTEPEFSSTDAKKTYSPTPDNHYNQIFKTTPLEALGQNLPIYYERNLKNLIAIARANNVNSLIVTWAYSDQMGDYIDSDVYKLGITEVNDVMRKVAKSLEIPIYDFSNEMPKDKKYWADGRHNNEEGTYLKGTLFARYIFESNLIKFH